MSQEDISSNRSALREFLASIATISGDLSNITAPPFVLLENSTTELPQFQADHTELFLAPATEDDPAKRALLVLKNFLGSLRNQQYAGRSEDAGMKKPLNAFLGELFMGSWQDEELGETRVLSEQVSHHPPITACYIWNEKLGISAQGFTQQEITFSGNVHIKQKGYALLHLDAYDEEFLIPVPNVKVKGILTGPYPELSGEYNLISSSGYVSHIKFEGRGFWGSGTKNGFHARTFHVDEPGKDIFTMHGAWNSTSTITDGRTGEVLETFDVDALKQRKLEVPDIEDQDPWESRCAWKHTISALRNGDMKRTTDSKSRIEQGQRAMRKDEASCGETWKPLFYTRVETDPVFDNLVKHDTNNSYTVDRAGGIWKIDLQAVQEKSRTRPFHADLTPTNHLITDEDWENASVRRSSEVTNGSSRRSSEASSRRSIDMSGNRNSIGMSSSSPAAQSLRSVAMSGHARANGNTNTYSPRNSLSIPSSSRNSLDTLGRKSVSSTSSTSTSHSDARSSFSSVDSRRSSADFHTSTEEARRRSEPPTEEMRNMRISHDEQRRSSAPISHTNANTKVRPSSGYFESMRQAAWSVTSGVGSVIGLTGSGKTEKAIDAERAEEKARNERTSVDGGREPTKREVEAFLRARNSNLHS